MESISEQPARTCTLCHQTLSLEDFYIKDKANGRRFSRCKACMSALHAATYLEAHGPRPTPKHALPLPPEITEKRCPSCGETKPVTAFGKQAGKSYGLRVHCRECHSREKAAYTAVNRERVTATNAAYRVARKEELREVSRQWRKDHPVRTAEIARTSKIKHEAERKVSNQTYRKAHAAHYATLGSKRRALKLGNGGSHTEAEWEALKARYGNRCLFCGRTNRPLTKDHVLPVTKGGTDTIDNIQPLCGPCNSSKSARHIDFRPIPPL